MNTQYRKSGQYDRYGLQKRATTRRTQPWPWVVLAVSIFMLMTSIVLVFVAKNPSTARKNAAIPTAIPQIVTVDDSAETAAVVQRLLDEAVAGNVSQETKDSVVASGVSESSVNALIELIRSEPENGAYTDGVYTGTGQGEKGTIKAEVTIENGRILYIAVVAHSEKGAVTKEVFEPIAITVIKNQSTDGIDSISGATVVSEGYIAAITEALSMAK